MTIQETAVGSGGAGRSREAVWIGLTALTVLFGVQSLRALMPLAIFVLRDRFGWPSGVVGLAVLGVLAAGFLAAPAWRAAGGRFLWLSAGGLGLARLALQAWTGEPLVDLGLAVAAAIFFFLALPALVARGSQRAGATFALGWLIGLAADTALLGAYATWDMSWHADPASLATILGLVGMQGWLLVATREDVASPTNTLGWAWVTIGPLLFLELLLFSNVARLAALTGWRVEAATLWAVTGRVLAVALAGMTVARGRRPGWPATALAASALLASFLVAWPRGITAAAYLLVGQVSAALLWALIAVVAGEGSTRRAGRRLSLSHGVGLVTFGILLFLYYGGFDLRLPLPRDLVPAAAAVGLTVAALAARGSAARTAADRRHGYAWMATAVLLAAPLVRLGAAPEVRAGDATGFPLRVMTYNLHLGISPRGQLSLEQLAATIEAEHPDVVALQEVPRGWVVTGSVDVLGWLSRRLDMSYVFAPTADPLWGNAVLSRRPILEHRALELPPDDLLIPRGFLSVRLDLGAGETFEVIATHFHHPRDGGEIRERQSRAILDFWQGHGRTVITGDFNARPGEPPFETLRSAGLGDVLDLAGVEPGYTYSSFEPRKRIDTIWISPDLIASDVAVPSSPASDHLPVVATLAVSAAGRSSARD